MGDEPIKTWPLEGTYAACLPSMIPGEDLDDRKHKKIAVDIFSDLGREVEEAEGCFIGPLSHIDGYRRLTYNYKTCGFRWVSFFGLSREISVAWNDPDAEFWDPGSRKFVLMRQLRISKNEAVAVGCVGLVGPKSVLPGGVWLSTVLYLKINARLLGLTCIPLRLIRAILPRGHCLVSIIDSNIPFSNFHFPSSIALLQIVKTVLLGVPLPSKYDYPKSSTCYRQGQPSLHPFGR
jgi:hypothetical protein